MDNEKNDNMVDKAIDADARSVSLFSWEERIYSAGDVGKVKKIRPTLRISPETPNNIKNKYPETGSTSNLNTDETRDIL